MSYNPTTWKSGDKVTSNKLNKIEQAIVADNTAIEGKVGRDEFDTEIATLESKVGSPLIASTVSEMTETDRVYVYTGSETGYTSGNWYYYDGTAWTSGGVYNAVAIETDTTLSVSGKAADAKKAGDEINSLKEDLIINDPPTVTWQIGGFNSDGAINSSNKYAIRNKGGAAIAITKDGTIGCASGYRIKVVKYSGIVMGAGRCLSNSGWVTAPIAVSAGDYVGISIMYGTDTSAVLDDTSISANVILTFRTLKIADNSIAKAKLTADIQSLLDDTASALPQVASNTSDIATIAEWVDLPTNIAYVTDGVSATHYGVTYEKSASNALSLYGTSSGLGFFNVFNGANGYGNSGSSTPAKNLTAGTYIVDFDGTESNKVEVCYTDSTYSNRTVLRSGQILVVGDGGGAIFARIYGSKNFGTEESPTVLKLSMRNVSYNHGPYNVYGRDFSEWYSGLNGDYSLYGFGWSTKYADVIALYDALVTAYPDYITKTALGQGSGTDSQGNAYYLYEYAFVPKIKASGLNTRKTPKILMDACIHGFEKNSALGLYCFLKDVCDQWENNKSLEYLRHFVEIRVIPVSCPWGFDNNDRRNYNGVNLNRNFPCAGWEAGEESGDAPLDQAESAIIADWIRANADMLYYLNLHTNGQYNAAGWSEANYCMSSNDRNDDYFNRIYTVFSRHITQQTYEFAKMYDIDFGGAFFGTIHTEASTESGKGTVQIYCHTYLGNVMGMTLESFNGVTVDGESAIAVLSPQSTKMCSEIIGNMVIQILGEYGE